MKPDRAREIMDEKDALIGRLMVRVHELEVALRHYANRDNWYHRVIDGYSGEVAIFDLDGDLADEPWEIAEKVLAGKEPKDG